MADSKYIGFVAETIIKLTVFLLICIVCDLFLPRFAPSASVGHLAALVMALVVSWFFLTYAEGNKRSFFSKGYMLENIVPGAAVGIAAAALAMAAEWVFGNLTISGFAASVDFNAVGITAVRYGLFPAIVFFGYFHHIIASDFGCIPAGIISSILYLAYSIFGTPVWDLVISGDFSDPRLVPILLNFLLMGAVSSAMIYYLGDMRSAAAFMTFAAFTRALAIALLNPVYKGDFMLYNSLQQSFMLVIVLAVVFVWLLVACVKKE